MHTVDHPCQDVDKILEYFASELELQCLLSTACSLFLPLGSDQSMNTINSASCKILHEIWQDSCEITL